MKSTSILFFILAFMSFSCRVQPQEYASNTDDIFLTFCFKPLDFTQPNTIHYFLQNVFSHKRYAQEFLPYNMSVHVMQFLEHGKAAKKSAEYLESALRLFYNKMKASPFVSAFTFIEFLDKSPVVIKQSCIACRYDSLYATIEKNMMDIFVPTFVSQFSLFKSNPEEFLKNLSHNVTLMIQDAFDVQDHIAQEQLKQMFVRFVELGLMKLMWTPHEQEEVWNSVKRISNQCVTLLEMNLISLDELDDLYKSLLERFCTFLDLAGSELSEELLETIKNDVMSGDMFMFELEEQEQAIETKKNRMCDVLIETQAKIEARKHGIITDIVIC